MSASQKIERWTTKGLPRLEPMRQINSSDDKVHSFHVGDFDGDGLDEVALLRTDRNHLLYLVINKIEHEEYLRPGLALTSTINSLQLFPLRGDPWYSLAFYRVAKNRAFIDLFDHRGGKRDSISTLWGKDLNNDGYWNGSIKAIHSLDLNRDRRQDLLAVFNTGADVAPRAIIGYDLYSRKKLMEVHFAPMVTNLIPSDINHDGEPELLVALAGASDGPSFAPFSRDSSYLAIIDLHGRILAHCAFGGESTYINAVPVDIDGDGRVEIVSGGFSLLKRASSFDRLWIFDGQTLALRQEIKLTGILDSVYGLVRGHDNSNGFHEFIAIDLSGNVAVLRYDPKLTTITVASRAQASTVAKFLYADDIDGNGHPEYFFTNQKAEKLWLVDHQLKALAWMALNYPGSQAEISSRIHSPSKEAQYLIKDGDDLLMLNIPPEIINPLPSLSLNFFGQEIRFTSPLWPWSILGGIVLLLGALVVTLKSRSRSSYFLHQLQSRLLAMALLDDKGFIRQYSATFPSLFGRETILVNKPLTKVIDSPELQSLVYLYRHFIEGSEFYACQIWGDDESSRLRNHAVELVRLHKPANWIALLMIDFSAYEPEERLKIWAAMAMRMAHKTKTPLATVSLAVQRLQRAYRKDFPDKAARYDQISEIALKEIDRVRDSINLFMKFAKLDPPSFTVDDLSVVVQEWLQEYLPRVPESVSLETKFELVEMPVKVDRMQLAEALNNILDNAITAMKGSGQLLISTLREKQPLSSPGQTDLALIEVTDSGIGISEDEMQQLFRLGYSTSDTGSGMGLFLARGIIETHGGTLEIYSNPPHGTSVYIRLPILKTVEAS